MPDDMTARAMTPAREPLRVLFCRVVWVAWTVLQPSCWLIGRPCSRLYRALRRFVLWEALEARAALRYARWVWSVTSDARTVADALNATRGPQPDVFPGSEINRALGLEAPAPTSAPPVVQADTESAAAPLIVPADWWRLN